MHVIYKITYIPHLNTPLPKYYIGSKYNYYEGYLGSVASKQVYDFTDGIPLKDWWRIQQTTSANFKFEVLKQFDIITPYDLVEQERLIQLEYAVMGEDYFNHSIATRGFCGCKRGERSRQLISEKTTAFWNSPEGEAKKSRLIERNKKLQSDIMKSRWADPELAETLRQRVSEAASKPRSDATKQKMSDARKKLIVYNGRVYRGWDELERQTGVTKYKYQRHHKEQNDTICNIG